MVRELTLDGGLTDLGGRFLDAMTMPAFSPDAYVVRYGGRGLLRGLGGLVAAAAIVIFCLVYPRSVLSQVIGFLFAAGVLFASLVELRKATSRDVVFAVHAGGVYFGSDLIKDDVPWSRICAVELFTEYVSNLKSGSWYKCVGVRSPGTRQISRPGNGPAMWGSTDREIQYYVDANRADLLPGADGTIRYAYRRMSGWRADPQRLAAAVGRFAPGVLVISGQNYPPPFSSGDVRTARRNR
jgi:hypothetical protein